MASSRILAAATVSRRATAPTGGRKDHKVAEAGPQTFRVLISDPLAESGLRILREQPDIDVTNAPNLTYEELVGCIGDYDALLIRS